MPSYFKKFVCLFVLLICLYSIFVWRSNQTLTKPRTHDQSIISNKHSKMAISVNVKDSHVFKNNSEEFIIEMDKRYGDIWATDVTPVNVTLTVEENSRMKTCIINGPRDRGHNGSRFWPVEQIRRTHHGYLKKEEAVLIEVGGNKGNDASEFVRLYNPNYIILEPLEYYASVLKKKFQNNTRVSVFNVGLGVKNEIVFVQIEGNNACATSKFATSSAKGKAKVPLYLANTTEFLTKIGVGFFEVDLITLNCEGCEFEALETLLSTTLVRHFRNIQFATHSTLGGLKDAIPRYCRIQELLSRTHRPTYQYRFIWESWRRRDL